MTDEPNINKIGKSIVDLLILAGMASSKREARQFIKDGAVRLGDFKVTDPMARAFLDENDNWKVIERVNR